MKVRVAAFGVFCVLAWAQTPGPYPGQTPRPPIGGAPGNYPPGTYPPGTYPPGTGPGGGTTIPLPGRVPGGTSRSPQPSTTISTSPYVQVLTTTGIVRRFTPKLLIVEADDHRIVWFQRADNFKMEDATGQIVSDERFAPGDHVTVDAAQNDEGYYRASVLRWMKESTAEDRAAAALNWDLPTAAQLPKEARPGTNNERPVLRRGGPPPKAEPPEEPTRAAKTDDRPSPAPLPERADDPSIARARAAALAFLETLPNFAARQSTMRYGRTAARGEWIAQDVVTANLVYRDGEEVYSDIRVGRDRVEGLLEDIQGLRSTGEFGSLLEEIFEPETGAAFVRGSADQVGGRRAVRFAFAIPRDRSRFRIQAPSESYYAAYRGTLWIDVETDRVLRLEEQATGLPEAFPFDRVELAVDYEFIRLETKLFLLPVEAQALNCIRETSVCMRNQTSFRNYTKYEVESGIVFEK